MITGIDLAAIDLAAGPCLMVFSHPNHELAILGIVQRLRPHLVFLTDGGGERRMAETRVGLATAGGEERARFLAHPENDFYRGLLAGDTEFFEGVARQVREAIFETGARHVLCDAVEFYNPVHDLALPIARAALRGRPGTRLFEVPLIHQAPAPGTERYVIQRFPKGRESAVLRYRLSPAELAVKTRARETVYRLLGEQMGSFLGELPPARLAEEIVAPAAPAQGEPDGDVVLRYEWRGRALRDRGLVERVITYRDHYRPLAAALTAGAAG